MAANITLLPLPARSPERDPVENLRRFMRDTWLGSRILASDEAILDRGCGAGNRLIDQPWRVMSIGLRARADEFRSMRAGNRAFSAEVVCGSASENAAEQRDSAFSVIQGSWKTR